MSYISKGSALRAMLRDIATAVAGDPDGRPRRVAEALRPFLNDPLLLAGLDCASRPEGYTRHLLQADPDGRYAVVALSWRPGQMSPIHAHRTWCSFGVHRGVLTEGYYRGVEEGHPAQTASLLHRPGAIVHGAADPAAAHRLANLDGEEALSIHVYGAAFERFGQDVNLVYAA
ncbi:cysteine dioxygenase family protein [Pseudoroseomonas sp. WGS1072]|uniref:cysteine dioxygenase family protein n=1 Tax=Roseomonas sp. WGS1072 TaxID=3366816 RepID=UPI003BF43339